MGRTGPTSVSAVRSLSGVNRTSHRKLISVAVDPSRTFDLSQNPHGIGLVGPSWRGDGAGRKRCRPIRFAPMLPVTVPRPVPLTLYNKLAKIMGIPQETRHDETGNHRFHWVDLYARRVHGLRGEGDRIRADGDTAARGGTPCHPSFRQNAGAAPWRFRTLRIKGHRQLSRSQLPGPVRISV